MVKIVKAKIAKYLHEEKGQALIAVLVLLMIGSLTLPPTLSHISTSLKTGQVYETKTNELYAADSGIEDAIWQIKYDRLEVLFTDPEYDIYDFDMVWPYSLSEPINELPVDVDIRNIWIPKDITPLSPAEGRAIIESNKLMVSGTVPGESSYKIKISFYPVEGEEYDLMIESIGIWLPLGYTYVTGSSNLEQADPGEVYYSEPTVSDHAGGQAIVWDFTSAPFASFPGVDPEAPPMTTDITFEFTSAQPGVSPVAISWVVTSGVSDVPLSWDIDTRIYQINSIAGDTEIEAYTAKCELRKMGAAIAGDYRAVGNSLMRDNVWDPWNVRDELIDESGAEITDIPSTAEVVAAYLYWSGWLAEGTPNTVWEDDCKDFGNWISGSCWNIYDGHFRSHYSSGAEQTRYNTMKDSLDLSSYSSGTVTVSWEHWEDGTLEGSPSADALRFQFSGNGGSSWSSMITAFSNDIGSTPQYYSYTIPSQYLTNNFKFRFYLQNFGGGDEFCHVDNFAISEIVQTADETAVFKINDQQVYLDGDGNPQVGSGEINADEWQTLTTDYGYGYACNADVTMLVREYSNQGDYTNHTGNAEYTAGSIDGDLDEQLSYAGWSLVVVYSSPETKGHQLYLYDDFFYTHVPNVDFDGDGQPGGTITGFLIPDPIPGEENAASITCFVGEGDDRWVGDSLAFNGAYLSDAYNPWNNVWNSQSEGMSEDGVDVDTFRISWASGLLEPGDTTALLEMRNAEDGEAWFTIYIILSLRSQTITGGTVHYVIRNN